MGRKRKVDTGIGAVAKENNTSTPCPKENIHYHTRNSTNSMKATNVETSVRPDLNPLPHKRKTPKVRSERVRQSDRLKSSVFVGGSKKVEHVVEHVNLVESEMVEAQQVDTGPTPTERNLEREAPQIQQLNSVKAVDGRNLAQKHNTRRPSDGKSSDLCYKSLYFDSQKKNDELMENNFQLVRKLDVALGKIEAYEKMLVAVGAPKEVILASNLKKATTEATISP